IYRELQSFRFCVRVSTGIALHLNEWFVSPPLCAQVAPTLITCALWPKFLRFSSRAELIVNIVVIVLHTLLCASDERIDSRSRGYRLGTICDERQLCL